LVFLILKLKRKSGFKKPFPVFLVASIFSAFLFLFATMRTRDHLHSPGEWSLLDEVIMITIFLSILAVGILYPEKGHKQAHPEEQEEHDPADPGDDDAELQEGA
jgi:hypothetical protein